MQDMIESFNLPFEHFRSFVTEHKLIIAGNIATCGYFRQENLQPYPTSDQLCIWSSPIDEQHLLFFLGQYRYYIQATISFGNDVDEGPPYIKEHQFFNYTTDHTIIVRVSHFYDPLRIIRSVHYNDTDSFTSWWISQTDRFETSYPELTKAMKVFLYNHVDHVWVTRSVKSLEFYQLLGFTIIDKDEDEICRPFDMEDDEKNLLLSLMFHLKIRLMVKKHLILYHMKMF